MGRRPIHHATHFDGEIPSGLLLDALAIGFDERISKKHYFKKAGLTVLAMPPGKVIGTGRFERTSINVQPLGCTSEWALQELNGKTYDSFVRHGGAFDVFADGGLMELDAANDGWEALIEIDTAALSRIDAEAHDGTFEMTTDAYGRVDTPAAQLGALMLEHMRFGTRDDLYLETLTIALTARALSLGQPPQRIVSARGNGKRIARAIEYLHAHLEHAPSIAELADIAAMSPSWFARSFKAETGEAVHAYARRLRLERAKALLLATDLPIAVVTHRCGFSDQSHLTRQFRTAYGVTPAAFRRR